MISSAHPHKRGFTLIEIIVSISILAIILSIVLVAINIPRQFMLANDLKRKVDLNNLHKTMINYFTDNKNYPSSALWENSSCLGSLTDKLKPYMASMPCDPDSKEKYYYQPLDSYCMPCDATKNNCKGFVLLTELKNPQDKAITESGCDSEKGCYLKNPAGNPYNYGISVGCTLSDAIHPAWKTADESLKQNEIDPSGKILEVEISYDSSNNPDLGITTLSIKNGYAPSTVALNAPYSLSLADENGLTIYSTPFTIPNELLGPPPQPGNEQETEQGGSLQKVDFIITIPWNNQIKTVIIKDSNGQTVTILPSSQASTFENAPNFYSVPGDDVMPSKKQVSSNLFINEVFAQNNYNGKVDITFIGDDYLTASDLSRFHADVDRFIKQLLTYEPYKSNAARLSFHYVDNTSDLGCHTSGRLATCNNSLVYKALNSSQAPYDIVSVIYNNNVYGGSGDYYFAVSYNGSDWGPQIFVHELGHSFGLLADEYLASNNHPIELNGLNCHHTTPPNPSWNGIINSSDYNAECNYPSWYRSSSDSIMRSINSYLFNPVSRNAITAQIDLYAPVNQNSCKSLNAECEINNSNKSCCSGLACIPFNQSSGNGKCQTVSPTPFPSPTITISPTFTPTLTPSPSPTLIPSLTPTFTPIPTQVQISNPGCRNYSLNSFWGIRTTPSPPTYPDGWFVSGTLNGQFNYPHGIRSDNLGFIYVADTTNNRLQKLTSEGIYLTKWGSYGNGSGQFNRIQAVAIDNSGNVYTFDEDYPYNTYNRIQKFDANGNFITKWGSYGTGQGQFNRPEYIAVDTSGNVYVSDLGNSRIQKFDPSGNFLTMWGTKGSGNGQFINPRGLAFDSNGRVYVADSGNGRIQIFDSVGNYITQFGSICETGQNMQYGTCIGKFFWPADLVIDTNNNIIVLDRENNRVQKFDSNFNFITGFGAYAKTHGAVGFFRSPSGITIDPSGNIYIADYNRHNIQKFSCSE
jgi:prepilin-type N-terminal cleavage/methylation domain-containing protein